MAENEQIIDVSLDTEYKQVESAFDYIKGEVSRLQKAVRDIGKDSYKSAEAFGQSLKSTTKDLQSALGMLRTLSGPGTKSGDYDSALKELRDKSKQHFAIEEQSRKESNARQIAEEQRAANAFTSINAKADAAQAESRKLASAARLEDTRARIQDNSRLISSEGELASARAKNASDLARYRAAARSETDPTQQRALATLIDLEKTRGKALDTQERSLNKLTATRDREIASMGRQSEAQQRLTAAQSRQVEKAYAGYSGPTASQKAAQEEAMFAAYERANKPVAYAPTLAERGGEGITSKINQGAIEAEAQQLSSLQALRGAAARDELAQTAAIKTARLDAAKAKAASDVKEITDQKTLADVRAANVAETRRLRDAQATETNPEQLRAISALLQIEKERATAIRQVTSELNKQAAAEERERVVADKKKEVAARSSLVGRATTAIANTALYGGVAAVGYGAFNALSGGASQFADLEDEFAKLQAISASTDDQMQKLKGTIFSVGDASKYSDGDIIKIAQTLAQAGVTAGQMESVLRSVVTLATASGSTTDEAVQLVTSTIGAFNLQASEAGRVADLLTAALNRTKLTVGQVGTAIQYVGATAFEQNVGLEQLLATIGAVAQAGVKSGSTIGTGFRQFLIDLQEPTKKLKEQLTNLGLTTADVDVKVRGLPAVLDTLTKAGFGSQQAYAGLETRAAAFYLVAKNNVDVMDQLQLAFATTGAAQEANTRAMDSLEASYQRFKNTLTEALSGPAEGMLQWLKTALDGFTDLIRKINEYNQTPLRSSAARATENAAGYTALGAGAGAVIGGALGTLGGPFAPLTVAAGAQAGTLLGGYIGTASAIRQYNKEAAEGVDVNKSLETAVSDANDRVSQQASKISEVQKEYTRLITQGESLRGNTLRVNAETVTLTARFKGLAGFLTNTGNAYDDLTGAVQRYIAASQGLGPDGQLTGLKLQASALSQQRNQAAQAGASNIGLIRNNPGYLNQIGSGGLAAINALRDNGSDSAKFVNATRVIADLSTKLSASSPALSKLLDTIANSASAVTGANAQLRGNASSQVSAAFASSPQGSTVTSLLSQIDSGITKLGSEQNGTSLKAKTTAETSSLISKTTTMVNNLLKTASGESRRNLLGIQGQLGAFAQQVKAANTPTDEEKKDAERADREASKRPKITQGDVDTILKGFGLSFGRGHDDSPAARAAEDALHARGLTPATGLTSGHTAPGGIARDLSVAGKSDAEAKRMVTAIQKQLSDAGIDGFVQFETGKGKNQGTGRHIHVSVRPGTRFGKDKTVASAAQVQATQDASDVAADQNTYQQALKTLAKSTTEGAFNTAVKAGENALGKLNKDLEQKAKNDLASQGIVEGMAGYEDKMRDVRQTIEANTQAFQQAVADGLVKNIEAQIKAADAAFKRAIQPSSDALSFSQGQLSGLDYYSNRNKVPDYVKQLATDRVQQNQQTLDRATASALPSQIASQQSSLAQLQARMAVIKQQAANSGTSPEENAGYGTISAEIDKLTQSIADLTAKKQALDAALGSSGILPTTVAGGLDQAVQAFSQANDLSKSFKDTVIMNLGGAIETVHSGLTDMFTSIFTGSKSALGAFGDFAKGIMQYMEQIAAKFVAEQALNGLFKLLGVGLNLTGGLSTGRAGVGDASTVFNNPDYSFGYNGGKVGSVLSGPMRNRFLGGGKVMNGVRSNDSVDAKLAQGEWVVNGGAAASVGDKFMSDLNSKGAAALSKTAAVPAISMPKQTTNVYVVSPDQQPTLGRNDVLVTVNNDILQGGETKKLIKAVMQGM